jgi:ABC-type nitrate/sulfonate/bicarbonate transport system permease component
MKEHILLATLISLGITLGGFVAGVIAGIALGLAIAYSKDFMEVVGPFLDFTRPVPVLALIPLFLLWFGIGFMPQILLVALGVSVILGVSTYEAVRNMPLVYIRAAANLGADKKLIFRTVVIPYIFPHLIGAIRVGAAVSWGLDVASEFMGAQIGLGYNMIVQQIYLNTSGIIAIVFIYSILAIGLDQIIRKVEGRLTHWTERSRISFEKI